MRINKVYFSKIILILVISFLALTLPNNLSALNNDYEVGLKVLKYDFDTYGNDLENNWLPEYYQNDTEAVLASDVLNADAELKPNDYILLGLVLKHKGINPADAVRISAYINIDSELFEIVRTSEDVDITYDMRVTDDGGVFPKASAARKWKIDDNAYEINNYLTYVNVYTGNIAYPYPFASTADQPFAFVLLKVKENAPAGKQVKFEFLNDTFNGTETIYSDANYNSYDFTINNLTTMKIKEEEKVLSKDNTLSEVKAVYNGVDYIASYDDATKTYTIVVPNSASNVTLYATKNDPNATIVSTDASETGIQKTLSVGNNEYTVSVNAEDPSVEVANYNIVVKRLDNSANLDTLTLSGITTGFSFNPTTYTYNITVPFKTASTTIAASLPTTNTTATIVSGTGAWNLTNTGSTLNTQKVKVESETCKAEYASVVGNTCDFKEYTINITRTAPDTDSTLSSLEVKTSSTGTAYTMTPTFSTGTLTGYKVKVPFETTSVYIDASATSSLVGSVTGTGNKTLSGNSTQADIVVTAEDGTKSTYIVTIEKELSNDATLTALSVNGTAIPGFTPNTEDYSTGGSVIEVNGNINSVTVDYTKGNQYSTVNPTSKTIALTSDGDNIITISVTSQDGSSTKNYKFKVYRKSRNANLQGLSVTSTPQGTMSPATFDPNTKTYTYTYDESVTGITIAATKGETHQTITGERTYNPKTEASATIGITAEDGTTNSYTVNFSRKTSTDNSLSSVVLEYTDASNTLQTVTLTASGNTYTGTVPYEAKNVTVKATATSGEATVSGNGTWTLSNTGSTLNTQTITVQAESGVTASYTLNVTRTPSNNNYLSDIKLDGTTLSDFNKTKTDYTVADVKSTVNQLNLTFTTENPDARATIKSGTKNLTPGNNTVTIVVTAQDGTTKEYNVHVKKLSGDATATNLTIVSTPTNSANTLTNSGTAYTYKYDRNTTNFDINLTLPAGATISSATKTSYTKAEIEANNVVTITVIAEDTDITKDYTVTFEQIKETDNKLTSLTVKNTTDSTNYSLTPGFTGTSSGPYSVTVPSDVDKVTVTATVSGDHTKGITITGGTFTNGTNPKEHTIDITLTPGSNSKTITVTAEDDSTKTYTLNITRTINSDATLSDLTVDGTTITGFASGTTSYDLGSLPYATKNINLGATASVTTGTTITGTGVQVLNVGPNTFEIEVTAASGATGKYTVTARRKSNVSTLTGITTNVTGTDVRSTGTNEYTIDIPAGTTSISLTPNLTDSIHGSLVTSSSEYTNIDLTTVTEKDIIVAAEDTDPQYNTTYKVKFNVLQSTNVYLGSLTVDQGILDPSFNKETTHYKVTVGTTIDKITITAIPEDPLSEITTDSDTGEQTLDFGNNTFTITVKAQNNDTKDYTIIVNRETADISTVYLTDINVTDHTLDKTFDQTDLNYNINNVTIDTNSLTINATTTVDGGAITYGLNENTPTSSNVIDITGVNNGTIKVNVTAGGVTKTYNLGFTKADPSTINLTDISVEGHTLNKAFDQTDLNYSINNVTTETNSLTINATTTIDGAEITYGLNNNTPTTNNVIDITSVNNGTVKVNIKVDGYTKTYELAFTKVDLSTIFLTTLSVDGHTLNPTFDQDTLNYTIEGMTSTTNSLTINASTTTPSSTISYELDTNGATNNNVIDITSVESGTVKVHITVDGATKTYNLAFNKNGGDTGLNKITSAKKDDGVTDIHRIEGGGIGDPTVYYIWTGRPQLASSDFKKEFANEYSELHIYKVDGTELGETEVIRTGMTMKLERNGSILDEKDIIILADTNGDGKVNITDAVRITQHIREEKPLTGAFLEASNTKVDNRINITDAVRITQHIREENPFVW